MAKTKVGGRVEEQRSLDEESITIREVGRSGVLVREMVVQTADIVAVITDREGDYTIAGVDDPPKRGRR